jgi:hypothetical protein
MAEEWVKFETIYLNPATVLPSEVRIFNWAKERAEVREEGKVYEYYLLNPVRTPLGPIVPVLKFENGLETS